MEALPLHPRVGLGLMHRSVMHLLHNCLAVPDLVTWGAFIHFGGWGLLNLERNDAAKSTKRRGRRWRMSKPPSFGEFG